MKASCRNTIEKGEVPTMTDFEFSVFFTVNENLDEANLRLDAIVQRVMNKMGTDEVVADITELTDGLSVRVMYRAETEFPFVENLLETAEGWMKKYKVTLDRVQYPTGE